MQTQSEVGYNTKIEGDVVLTTVDAALSWFRANSVWPMPMGLACCAIELMAVGASRFDISRFGSEVMRFSPRQADCMIVAGTVTYKAAGFLKRIYDQMPEPKWVIAMGACASTGGMYRRRTHHTTKPRARRGIRPPCRHHWSRSACVQSLNATPRPCSQWSNLTMLLTSFRILTL